MMNKDDLRVRRTTDHLRQTLIVLLQTMPFTIITVKLICERAEINRGTFYQHYSDKKELLLDVFGVLTNDNLTIDINELFHNPFVAFIGLVHEPLPLIIERQAGDNEFYWLYRQYFVKYYTTLFNQISWRSEVPRELAAYALIGIALSFDEWQRDYRVQLSKSQFNELFQQLVRLPDNVNR